MGYSGLYPTEEDTFCAEYIRNSVLELPTDLQKMIDIIRFTSGKRLFEPTNQEHSPETDFFLCTEIGKFDFVIKADIKNEGAIELKKIFC